jgi:hypothetical protein
VPRSFVFQTYRGGAEERRARRPDRNYREESADQLEDYAARMGVSREEIQRSLPGLGS